MKRTTLCVIVFLSLCAIVFLAVSKCSRNSIDNPESDEVGLSELQRYATAHSLNLNDFEQPTIWVQLTSEARKDPRGQCVTVCYKTRSNINPRHVLLLYLTPRRGVIDEESLVEDLSEETSHGRNKEGTNP